MKIGQLKPQGERILVKRFAAEGKSAGGIILPDSSKEAPQEGIILEMGTEKTKNLKKNDQVLFAKFAGTAIDDDKHYLIMGYADVIAVVNK